MAANVVDVFIHALEHTRAHRISMSVSLLPKLKLFFFFSWTKRKLFDQVRPEQFCWLRAWSYYEKKIKSSVGVRRENEIAGLGLEVYVIAFSFLMFHFY